MTNEVTVRTIENLDSEFLHSLCQERTFATENCNPLICLEANIGSI